MLQQAPSFPSRFLVGGRSVKHFGSIPPSAKSNGTAVVFSPKLPPFAGRWALDGWLSAATLTLSGYSRNLFVFVYAFNDKRPEVEKLLVPLLQKYDHHIIGGGFNAVPCPLLDLSLTDDPPSPGTG